MSVLKSESPFGCAKSRRAADTLAGAITLTQCRVEARRPLRLGGSDSRPEALLPTADFGFTHPAFANRMSEKLASRAMRG
jgi:hypothetical protein